MICIYKDLTYTLAQSDRKTMSIYVDRDGNILVRAPKDLPSNKLDAIMDLKSYWIYKSISEMQELNRNRVTRHIANGEGFLYMGKSYRLKIEKGLKTPLALSNGYFLLSEAGADNARKHFINFYREKGKQHLSERVKYYGKKIGVDVSSIRVMDLKTRWASRSNKGLNFHWKVMLAPMSIIDYLVVHELAHFKKADHSHEFWELVESVMPNYREKKNWLRVNGANLDS